MFQAGGRGPIGRCFNVLHSVLERASNKDAHENGKYELMLGYTLPVNSCGSQISQLPTSSYPKDPYMKRTLPSGTPAMVVSTIRLHHDQHVTGYPFLNIPMKHVPRKSSHKRSLKLGLIFVCCLMVTSPGCGHRQRVARLGNKDYLNGTPFFLEGDQTWCTYCR